MGSKQIVRKDALTNYLLVEGKNDMYVMKSLLKYHSIPEKFEVEYKEGVVELLEVFEVRLELREFESLGIIVDADDVLTSRWQNIQRILRNAGYMSVPNMPVPEGTIIDESELPVIGIWIMPDNKIPGKLEDFIGFLRPQEDVLWPMAVDIVQQVKAVETRLRFRDVHESKARIHTWLAWQEEPGKPMGTAITARYLDADAPHAKLLIDWIRELFDLASI